MKDELLVRLESFGIDKPGAAFPLSARLARENAWSRAYASRVIREYFRFVWLAMRAGHPVTPSAAVDEAWHLHLCYTRSYWKDLCGNVLGKPLHHGPTEGGAAEAQKFTDWYARTLASYRLHFGAEPPADIWPAVAGRFRAAPGRKVDPRGYWIIRKRGVLAAVPLAGIGTGAAVLAGCAPPVIGVGLEDFVSVGVPVLVFLLLFVAVCAGVSRVSRGSSGKHGNTGGGCSSAGGTDGRCSSSGGDASGCGSSGCGGGGCGGGD